jgi:hypothetical protein
MFVPPVRRSACGREVHHGVPVREKIQNPSTERFTMRHCVEEKSRRHRQSEREIAHCAAGINALLLALEVEESNHLFRRRA